MRSDLFEPSSQVVKSLNLTIAFKRTCGDCAIFRHSCPGCLSSRLPIFCALAGVQNQSVYFVFWGAVFLCFSPESPCKFIFHNEIGRLSRFFIEEIRCQARVGCSCRQSERAGAGVITAISTNGGGVGLGGGAGVRIAQVKAWDRPDCRIVMATHRLIGDPKSTPKWGDSLAGIAAMCQLALWCGGLRQGYSDLRLVERSEMDGSNRSPQPVISVADQ